MRVFGATSVTTSQFTNRLVNETNPYLLQHTQN